MEFWQHDDYTLWRRQRVIYATLTGTWNQQAAQNFARDFKQTVKPLLLDPPSQPWGHMVYLDAWELCSSDTFDTITALVTWSVEHGLTHAAHVYTASTIKTQFLSMMVEERDGFVRRRFEHPQQAAHWLDAQGYATSLQTPDEVVVIE